MKKTKSMRKLKPFTSKSHTLVKKQNRLFLPWEHKSVFLQETKNPLGESFNYRIETRPDNERRNCNRKKFNFLFFKKRTKQGKSRDEYLFSNKIHEEGKRTLAGKSKTQDINRNLKGKIKSNECRYGTEAHQLSGLQKGQFLYCKNERARVKRWKCTKSAYRRKGR